MTRAEKTNSFTTTIRSRNRRELVVGAGMLVLFGRETALAAPGTAEFYGSLALLLGVASILAFLFLLCGVRGDLQRLPPDDLKRWQGEYRRHARLLRLAPLWYELPLLPGIALVVYSARGASIGLHISVIAAIIIAFGLVAWLNLRAAHRLEEQAKELGES